VWGSVVALVFHPDRGLQQVNGELARTFPGQVGPVLRVETDDDAMCAVRADSHAGPALARDAFDGGPPRTVVFDGFVVCEVVGRAPTRARDDDVHAVLSCGYRGSALSGVFHLRPGRRRVRRALLVLGARPRSTLLGGEGKGASK